MSSDIVPRLTPTLSRPLASARLSRPLDSSVTPFVLGLFLPAVSLDHLGLRLECEHVRFDPAPQEAGTEVLLRQVETTKFP